jgi:hypothetical protein
MATRIAVEISRRQETGSATKLQAALDQETGVSWAAQETAAVTGKLGISSLIITAVIAGSAEETTRMAVAQATKVIEGWKARHLDPPDVRLTTERIAEDDAGDVPADET